MVTAIRRKDHPEDPGGLTEALAEGIILSAAEGLVEGVILSLSRGSS
jgi:hypothetical protein